MLRVSGKLSRRSFLFLLIFNLNNIMEEKRIFLFMKNFFKFTFFIFVLIGVVFGATYIYAFSPYFVFYPEADVATGEFSPDQSLIIKFPKSINTEYYRDKIKITPETSMKAVINEELNQVVITPKSAWKVNADYRVEIPKGRTENLMQMEGRIFNFKTVDYPKVISVNPQDKEADVQLDIEDPIKVKFDKSTEHFFIDFRLSPRAELDFQNNEEKTEFNILPKENLTEGANYKLEIFAKAKYAPDSSYYKIQETSFATLPPKPKTWAQNLEERVVQAKRFTPAQISEGKYIDVNLATQIMTIFEDGKLINSFLISSGKRGMDTPKGEHQIYNKFPRPWSKKYGLYMPFWMAITSDGKYGIHELPEWPGGYKEGQNHLGIPVSHGCMRLGVGPAEFVYNWAEIGTKVVIY